MILRPGRVCKVESPSGIFPVHSILPLYPIWFGPRAPVSPSPLRPKGRGVGNSESRDVLSRGAGRGAIGGAAALAVGVQSLVVFEAQRRTMRPWRSCTIKWLVTR
jgi:hypothetical protein